MGEVTLDLKSIASGLVEAWYVIDDYLAAVNPIPIPNLNPRRPQPPP